MNHLQKTMVLGLLVPALLTVPMGCETMSEHRVISGTAIGATAGALAGGIIGHQSGNKGAGIAIGALAGAALGAGVGAYLDHRAKKFEQIQDVEVERVPEKSSEQVQREYPQESARPEPEHLKLIINSMTLFEQGSSALNAQGSVKIDEVARVLNEQPDERIVVRGYTSSEGSDELNQGLSERRAKAVTNYLIGRGVDPGRITSIGMGESNPIGDNNTASGRSMNRRVEIEVFPSAKNQQSNNSTNSGTNGDANRSDY